MKTTIAIMTALLLIALCACASAEWYPMTARVMEVNYTEDTVTVMTSTGHLFAFYGCEDWQEGDCASLIMEDNGTENITDDEIVQARYSAWILIHW